MARYEFKLVITDVELSQKQQADVARAVALAGAARLGADLPEGAAIIPVEDADADFRRVFVCGLPGVDVAPPSL